MTYYRMGHFAMAVALAFISLLISTAEGLSILYNPDHVCGHCLYLGFKTFDNQCTLEEAKQHDYWNMIHPGNCTCTELAGVSCEYSPVCGHCSLGYKSFHNEDIYSIEAELYGYKMVHSGECESTEATDCPVFCTKEYEPICGYSYLYGYEDFSNKCELEAARKCDCSTYYYAHDGLCTDEEIACQMTHSGEYPTDNNDDDFNRYCDCDCK